jgi:hypothetical protein
MPVRFDQLRYGSQKLTVLVVYPAEAVAVKVVTMVDGVTRQLQTLLNRRVGYVLACAGATGAACLFRCGGRTVTVALAVLTEAGA